MSAARSAAQANRSVLMNKLINIDRNMSDASSWAGYLLMTYKRRHSPSDSWPMIAFKGSGGGGWVVLEQRDALGYSGTRHGSTDKLPTPTKPGVFTVEHLYWGPQLRFADLDCRREIVSWFLKLFQDVGILWCAGEPYVEPVLVSPCVRAWVCTLLITESTV